MPELPEVHTFQQYFNRHAQGRRIREVVVRDAKILRNLSAETFAERLGGRTVTGSYRRGKYLFAHLDNGQHLQLHFGMTGDLAAYAAPDEHPRHERWHWRFDDGGYLGYDCARKFSRICWVENLDQWIADLKLGPDALEISEALFVEKMARRRTTLKAFLLDQSQLAGVGNLYADEVCFQTRIHPGSTTTAIPNADKMLIFKTLRQILLDACERGAYYRDYPENWFWQWRVEGATGPDGQGRIERGVYAGRTTYWWDGQRLLV
jgi:formamidopyrimidine-DNA glycosylase